MNLVFDFGAVLFHWEPRALVSAHLSEFAPTPQATEQLARAIFGHRDWHEFDRGTHTVEAIAQRTAQRLGLERQALQAMISSIADRLEPIKGTVTALHELAQRRRVRGDVSLYFLSNMPESFARTLEQKHAFLAHFDGGIFSCDVRHIKPETEIFELLQTRYALEPGRTVLIDDQPLNVQAARKFGWQAVQYESSGQFQDWLDTRMATTQGDL